MGAIGIRLFLSLVELSGLVPEYWRVRFSGDTTPCNRPHEPHVAPFLDSRAHIRIVLEYNAKTIRFCDLLDESKKLELFPTVLNLDIEGLEEHIVLDSGMSQSSIPLLCIEHFLNEFTTDYSALAYGESKLVQHLQKSYYLVSICGISLIFARKDLYRPFS